MDTIGILYNPAVPEAARLSRKMGAWLEERGHSVHVGSNEASAEQLPWLAQADLLVSLGGDGSLLRVAHLASSRATPILGVNMGRVGFLTETEPETWSTVVSEVLSGHYWLEKRMMVCAVLNRQGHPVCTAEALNEVVVGRGARAHVVRLDTEVDGGSLATYVADGLIIATPTGSTAYALAAGGPILPPQLRNILLVPVAPHLSMDRPVVLSEGVKVRIRVAGHQEAVLTVDGAVQAELTPGDEVVVAASPHVAQFARVKEPTYFYKTLVNRLTPRN
jgi:NAD+ kinase